MTKTKTLMLAAFAALSVGACSAIAQDASGGSLDYRSRQNVIAAQKAAIPNRAVVPVPTGASDVGTETGSAHSPAYIYNHHLYEAGGVAG
jgi:hypothetical protein